MINIKLQTLYNEKDRDAFYTAVAAYCERNNVLREDTVEPIVEDLNEIVVLDYDEALAKIKAIHLTKSNVKSSVPDLIGDIYDILGITTGYIAYITKAIENEDTVKAVVSELKNSRALSRLINDLRDTGDAHE